MNNKMWKGKRLWAILAIALTALLLVTACAPAPTQPEEKKVLQIGAMDMLTGPAMEIDIPASKGRIDYIRYFNEQEMIPGVTVEYVWRDTALVLERWTSAYAAFKELGIPVMISNDSLGLAAYKETMARDKIPLITSNSATGLVYPPLWYYFIGPTFAEWYFILAEYFMENWQEERPPKIALCRSDTAHGTDPEFANERIKDLGFEVLPPAVVPMVTIDSTAQLAKLAAAGVDLVYIENTEVAAGVTMADAGRLGLRDIQWSGMWASVGPRSLAMAGDMMEGFLIPSTWPEVTETDVPGIKLMNDLQMKYRGKVEPDPNYRNGFIPAVIFCEALRRAVENVGYENVDGQAVKDALDSLKDFDVYGVATITYTADDHRGQPEAAISEVRGGKTVRIADWREAPSIPP